MKHRLPKPKTLDRRPETPVDELGRVTDSGSPPTAIRRATPPPLPFVNKSPSTPTEPSPTRAILPESPAAALIPEIPPKPAGTTDDDESFSFLSGPGETSPKEDKKDAEPKGADEINAILPASKTTPEEQKMVEPDSSAKRKTRRVEPPELPVVSASVVSEKAPEHIVAVTPRPASSPAPKGNSSDYLIETRGLVKQYGGRRVVNGVDIHVGPGEVVGLLGKNGAGKTTTFYMIVGLVTPTIGHVYMGEEDVTRMPMYRRARRGIGYLPQEESIFRKLTVEENLLAILETLPLTEEERDARCDELLKDFGLEHVRENVAITLSGGEKRRVTIARALVTNPTLLLLDEPFAGVDPMAVHDIQEIIYSLKKRGLGVLITDHTVRETLSVVDRAYIIDEGRVLSEGTREFILNDPIAREIYLGHRFSM
jgi:lipopolysaccharide export system ATP-binding protein